MKAQYGALTVYDDGKIEKDGKEVNQCNTNGYKVVRIDGKLMYVHRIVATAFIPNESGKPEVNHIDGNKSNNSVENLEWVTSSENRKHAYKYGLQPFYICEKCGSVIYGNKKNSAICRKCRNKMKIEENAQKKLSYLSLLYMQTDVSKLDETEVKIMEMLSSGENRKSIADSMNIPLKKVYDTVKKCRRLVDKVESIKIDIDSEKKKFSERLRKFRKTNGISQAKLAKMCGVSLTSISQYENAVSMPNIVIAVSIANALGTTCEELAGGDKYEP